MNLQLNNKTFLITGCTSGFGRATTISLITEGATVIGVARRENHLNELSAEFGDQFIGIDGDVTDMSTQDKIIEAIDKKNFYGALINAGGPPAKGFLETTLEDWDQSYANLLRWKISLVQKLVPLLLDQDFGRFVFIESCSVKQPVANLVLSNALRLAVVGFVKTLSQEIASSGITLNILAPGFHATPAVERVFIKQSQVKNVSVKEAEESFIASIPVQKLGTADDFASLATWLFSPFSQYITGQTISVDGGLIKGTMG